jgi:hypothetical protein
MTGVAGYSMRSVRPRRIWFGPRSTVDDQKSSQAAKDGWNDWQPFLEACDAKRFIQVALESTRSTQLGGYLSRAMRSQRKLAIADPVA